MDMINIYCLNFQRIENVIKNGFGLHSPWKTCDRPSREQGISFLLSPGSVMFVQLHSPLPEHALVVGPWLDLRGSDRILP